MSYEGKRHHGNTKRQLLDLVKNDAADDLLRSMLNFTANEVMVVKVSAKARSFQSSSASTLMIPLLP